MMLDKTAVIGDRIDPLPLAGRAVMGAMVGGIIARENRGSILLSALIGATAAVITAHLAYHARRRIPGASALGGLVEDAIVVAVGAYAARLHDGSDAARTPRLRAKLQRSGSRDRGLLDAS
jgi:hypothetical protein